MQSVLILLHYSMHIHELITYNHICVSPASRQTTTVNVASVALTATTSSSHLPRPRLHRIDHDHVFIASTTTTSSSHRPRLHLHRIDAQRHFRRVIRLGRVSSPATTLPPSITFLARRTPSRHDAWRFVRLGIKRSSLNRSCCEILLNSRRVKPTSTERVIVEINVIVEQRIVTAATN